MHCYSYITSTSIRCHYTTSFSIFDIIYQISTHQAIKTKNKIWPTMFCFVLVIWHAYSVSCFVLRVWGVMDFVLICHFEHVRSVMFVFLSSGTRATCNVLICSSFRTHLACHALFFCHLERVRRVMTCCCFFVIWNTYVLSCLILFLSFGTRTACHVLFLFLSFGTRTTCHVLF